jgi:hypothetical protein
LTVLFAVYAALALGMSFLMSLKEPRHIMGIIPSVAFLVGTLADWQRFFHWTAGKTRRLVGVGIVALLLTWDISPLTYPQQDLAKPYHWFDAQFAFRVFHSEHYYGALRAVGEVLGQHTPSDTIIAVVNQGTVVSYYADRPYRLLYTLPYDRAIEVLEKTEFLVFDRWVFLFQSESEMQDLRAYIDIHFEVFEIVKDPHKQVVIYQRKAS